MDIICKPNDTELFNGAWYFFLPFWPLREYIDPMKTCSATVAFVLNGDPLHLHSTDEYNKYKFENNHNGKIKLKPNCTDGD